MKLLFTGDINFRGKDNVTFDESEKILTEVLPCAKYADFVIPNLECLLADKGKHKPIKKSGPNLICAPENICFLKALNAYAVTIANNHIGDFGEGAVKDTLELLEENNILYACAGKDIKDAY
jgi:poly-gamma-glutamate capsule biosynthesis protein CapA/YwtB (metallophosphatase superfamily)